MNDHVLLNISTTTGKWFRKFVFNFNLTGVAYDKYISLQFAHIIVGTRGGVRQSYTSLDLLAAHARLKVSK